MKRLAKNLTCLRSYAKLKQQDVADKLQIKRNTWSNWENAVSQPSLDDIRKIAALFNVSLDVLINEDFNPTKHILTANSTRSVKIKIRNSKRIAEISDSISIIIDQLTIMRDKINGWS